MRSAVVARRVVTVLLAVALIAGLWELYKNAAPADGVSVGGLRILPRTGDAAMPHLMSIWHALGSQEVSLAGSSSVLTSIAAAGFFTLGLALGGFVVGLLIGVALALLMDRFRLAQRALLPWIVLSQTVPLIAIAPLISGWGAGLHIGGFQWQQWMSVAVIAAYLAFFPISVGMLRGLMAPTEINVELFHSLAAGWSTTLLRLKLPAAVPFLLPALRLGAAAAVVGAVVAETSIGVPGGIGRVIIDYSQQATGDPSRLYAAVLAAALLGLIAAALISLLELGLRSYSKGRTA